MSFSDYIYKTKTDEIRIKIWKRIDEYTNKLIGWDFDKFSRDGSVYTYGVEVGDVFPTKKEAKEYIEKEHGPITSINPECVTDGWK